MDVYVVKGLFKTLFGTPKSLIGIESFTKILKTAFKKLNVPYEDDCCPTTNAPVRFNKTTQKLEYLSDAATGTYTIVPDTAITP